MAEETTIEGEVTELPPFAPQKACGTIENRGLPPAEEKPAVAQAAAAHVSAAATATASALKDAFGSLGKAFASALGDRDQVVMVHVNRDALHHLDMLVAGEVTKNRSEGAAIMINEGIKASVELFDRINATAAQIAALRSQLREAVATEPDKPTEE